MNSPISLEEFMEKAFGPASEDYLKLKESAQKIEYDEDISAIPMYRLNGVAFTEPTLRGFYEWRNFDLHEDDIVVTSFPKTGTTWVQEIVYHVLHFDDTDKPDLKAIDERFPYVEFPDIPGALKKLRESPPPRLIKSHLPFSWLPLGECNKKYKIIYICRNPKDTLVSMYHFYKAGIHFKFNGSLQDFFKIFISDSVLYAPFWKHVLEFWDHRMDSNVLFLKYEDLHKHSEESVRKVAQFLGQSLTEEQMSKIVHRCSFSEMATNPASNHSQWENIHFDSNVSKFMRKGQVGNWKNFLDADMNRQMDAWIETNLQNSDFYFDYE